MSYGGRPFGGAVFGGGLSGGGSGAASDAITYGDTASATTNHQYASDGLSLIDSASAHEALLASASDTMAISDAASGAAHAFTGSAADSVTYSEAASGAQHGFGALTTDSLSYSDSGEAHNRYSATAGDLVAYADEGAGYLVGAGAVDSITYADSADGLVNLRGASDSISYGDSVGVVFIPITDLPTPLVLNPDLATQTLKSDRTTLTLDPGIGKLAVRNEPTGIRIDGP